MDFRIATLENNLSDLSVSSSGIIGYNPFLPGQIKILSGKTVPDVVKSFEILLSDFIKEFGFMDDILAVSLRACLMVPDVETRNRIFTNIRRTSNGSEKGTAQAKFEAVKAYGMELENHFTNEVLYTKTNTLSGFFGDLWNKVLKPAVCVAGTVAAATLTAGSSLVVQGLVGAGVGVATSFIKNPNQNIGQALNSALPGAVANISVPKFEPFKYGTSPSGLKQAQQEFQSLIAGLNSSPVGQAVVGTVSSIASAPGGKDLISTVTDFAKNTLSHVSGNVTYDADGVQINLSKEAGGAVKYSAGVTNDPTQAFFMNINPLYLIAGGLGLYLILKK